MQDESALRKYNEEYTKTYTGNSQCVLRPQTPEEVSRVLSYCSSRRLPVVPQGGRTSLVVGATPLLGEVVISLERMSRIYELSPYTGILKVQAGVLLENADKYCNERGFVFPLDLGARVRGIVYASFVGVLSDWRQSIHERGRSALREIRVAARKRGRTAGGAG